MPRLQLFAPAVGQEVVIEGGRTVLLANDKNYSSGCIVSSDDEDEGEAKKFKPEYDAHGSSRRKLDHRELFESWLGLMVAQLTSERNLGKSKDLYLGVKVFGQIKWLLWCAFSRRIFLGFPLLGHSPVMISDLSGMMDSWPKGKVSLGSTYQEQATHPQSGSMCAAAWHRRCASHCSKSAYEKPVTSLGTSFIFRRNWQT